MKRRSLVSICSFNVQELGWRGQAGGSGNLLYQNVHVIDNIVLYIQFL